MDSHHGRGAGVPPGVAAADGDGDAVAAAAGCAAARGGVLGLPLVLMTACCRQRRHAPQHTA
jgi:hypothetical protein